jgi:hypothetical protein
MARKTQEPRAPLPPPLYVQHVTIWWTKASRGMPLAGVRAQLPQTLPLAPAEIKALGMGGIHLVTMREEETFNPKIELQPLPHKDRFQVGALTVQCMEGGVHLAYRYTSMTGAPDRSHRPPIALEVMTGKLARIAYNGRFSGYSIEWLYKLSVITVAVGIPPSTDLFTLAPDHNIEDLADLF